MFVDTIYYPLVRALRDRPDETALSVKGEAYDNRRLAMLMAPVMKELDTFSDSAVALLMEEEAVTKAALFACMLCGKTVVPVWLSWNEEQQKRVVECSGARKFLTRERMFYYYWMTYEDAVCRIDDGLPVSRDLPYAARLYLFDGDGNMHDRYLTAEEWLRSLRHQGFIKPDELKCI